MSAKKYEIKSKTGRGNVTIRQIGTSQIKTVPRTSLPQKSQDELRRQERRRKK